MYMYMYMYMHMYMYMYIYIYIYIYIYMYMYMYICMYMMYLYMHMYAYAYVHIHTFAVLQLYSHVDASQTSGQAAIDDVTPPWPCSDYTNIIPQVFWHTRSRRISISNLLMMQILHDAVLTVFPWPARLDRGRTIKALNLHVFPHLTGRG